MITLTEVVWMSLCTLFLLFAAEEIWQAVKDRKAADIQADRELARQHVILGFMDLGTLFFFVLAGAAAALAEYAISPVVKDVLDGTVLFGLFAGLGCFGLRMFWRRIVRKRVFAVSQPNGLEAMLEEVRTDVKEIGKRGFTEAADRDKSQDDRSERQTARGVGQDKRGADQDERERRFNEHERQEP